MQRLTEIAILIILMIIAINSLVFTYMVATPTFDKSSIVASEIGKIVTVINSHSNRIKAVEQQAAPKKSRRK